MSELDKLLESVKEVTGPDRLLDIEIRKSIDAKMTEPHMLWRETEPYTASIDAALALVERCLPGVEISMKLNHPMYDWQTATIAAAPLKHVSGEEKTLPLAILSALLTALKSQGETNGRE